MLHSLLDLLACPKCFSALSCEAQEVDRAGEIIGGTLRCSTCETTYPVVAGIPRFVPSLNYAASFGYQWNQFRKEQLDSFSGTHLSRDRWFSETGWTEEGLRGSVVLDAGCGAGRFLDVASEAGCEVVGVDISNAVDAARANLGARGNVHLVQASIYELPFRSGTFDACYCIGVAQHAPDPPAVLRALPRVVKEGGEVAVTIYERRRWTKLNSKYLIRRLTRRLNDKALLVALRALMPVLFPISEILFRLPVAGRYFAFVIPVANYVDQKQSTLRQRYQLAVLDTFDMLSPAYDQPQTQLEATVALRSGGLQRIMRLPNPGLNLVGRKGST